MMKNVPSFSDLMGFNGIEWWFNGDLMEIPSGKRLHNYGESPCY